MQAILEYEGGVCGGCGFHRTVADADPNFSLEERICPICSAVEQELRVRGERDRKAAAAAGDNAAFPLPSDGRTRHVRLLSDAETEARRKG